MKILRFIFLLICMIPYIAVSQPGQDALRPDLGERVGTCDACGMDVFDKMLTKVEITLDNSTFFACGMGCAFGMTEGKSITAMKVVDFNSVSQIDAEKASYVTGSILIPVRAMMPVFAFGSSEEAALFVKKYGGTIHSFGQLRELSIRIREERKR
jgi:nitrous oxide reductase accessory protein NosL